VSAGSFRKGMVAWVSGQKNVEETVKDIDQSWPTG
jgi:hypothetical protein